MRAALLIGINFVREQRWPIFLLLLWVLLLAFLGLVTDVPRGSEDLLFIFKQDAVYIVAFSIFFGGSAIYNERKSRRILAVLAKAVPRRHYLSGLVLGVTIACGIYCFSLGLTASWTLGQAGFPVAQVWFFMASLITACMLASTVALMFSTFLNPFFAAGATAIVLGLPALASRTGSALGYSIPVYELTGAIMKSTFKSPGSPYWLPVLWAVAESGPFWMLGTWIFSRVDVAVSVE